MMAWCPVSPAKLARVSHLGSIFSSSARPTDAAQVLLACQRIVARDPRVCGKLAVDVTSSLKDAVLRRWEMTKLVALLPTEVLQKLSGLSPEAFQTRACQCQSVTLRTRGWRVWLVSRAQIRDLQNQDSATPIAAGLSQSGY